ncbi:hypothetical protein [Lewinella sp. IMCC34191]|uniref:hypothetical protein n=1 Tax=Lewinella sp. IMCC34191 TaxID=2259172 RepID=UPI000E25E854|nr:hypothetical protein [Lewinella sp. IMCC34191]
MHPVLQHLMDTNFEDLSGSRVDGRIAVSDDLINLGLHEVVAMLTKSSAAPAGKTESPAPESTPTPYDSTEKKAATPDPKALLRKLDVEKLQYRTETGRTVLEIACSVRK